MKYAPAKLLNTSPFLVTKVLWYCSFLVVPNWNRHCTGTLSMLPTVALKSVDWGEREVNMYEKKLMTSIMDGPMAKFAVLLCTYYSPLNQNPMHLYCWQLPHDLLFIRRTHVIASVFAFDMINCAIMYHYDSHVPKYLVCICSCNTTTTTWIQISRQNWNDFFSNASHHIMI